MRSMLTVLLTPGVVLTGGLVLAQPTPPAPAPVATPAAPDVAPAPAVAPRPATTPRAALPPLKVLTLPGDVDIETPLALAREALEVQFAQEGGPIKVAPEAIELEKLARLRAQADQPRAREVARIKWRGNCGEGAIDSQDEADAAYDCGRQALDRAAWDEALQSFTRVANARLGPRAAGAVYWRAYSQNRLGQRAEALATLGELKSAYPSSGWAAEANALEVEIRQSSGQRVSPDSGGDEDLKLLALQGLANSDVDSAVPMIEKLLQGTQSPRIKERALFVLAQSSKPAARDVVVKVAKGGSNPDLQLKAVQFVGMFRTPEGVKVLSEIYASNADQTVRRAILRSYMMANAREPLVAAARQESVPELRLEAVRQLGMMKAGTELAELYARETSPEVKKQILRGLAIGGQTDKLMSLAQTETDADLRRTAIRSLGLNRDASTGTMLTQLYAKEQSTEVREAVLDALYTQGNGAALVTIARQEKDPALKLAVVRRLSTMSTRSPEAKEYLLEILNK